jgi:cell wall-associated NlpC family hydrolase
MEATPQAASIAAVLYSIHIREQAAETVDRHQLRAGDVLFFSIEGKMSHVGLYVGEQRFVHAPQSGRSVSVESLQAPFYRRAFVRAGRLY